ncbi:MAG: MFS transporter [Nitrososphaerota archaeon]|nr:MFS transporter [Nitrososphaerota archaeon]
MGTASRGFLKTRSFLSYFGMNLSGRTASAVVNVAILLLVAKSANSLSQSAFYVTIVGVAETLAAVVTTLPAGVLVDRHDRRKLLVLANSVRAASFGLLAVVTALYGFQLLAVVAVAVVWNSAGELNRSTSYSVLPDLVSADAIADANGVTMAGFNLVGSASNALGGAMMAVAGAALAFGYGFVGYSAALVFSLLILRYAAKQKRTVDRERKMGTEIKEGFSWLVTQRGLLQLSVSALVFNFLFGMANAFLVLYVVFALGGGAILFGVVLAAFVVGNATGSLLVGKTGAIRHAGKVWVLCYGGGVGMLTLLMGAFPATPVAMAAIVAVGFAISFSGNVWLSSAQGLVPTAMRGRYFAVDGLLSFIGGPPSIATGGILIATFGVARMYEVVGVLMVISAAVFALMKNLWALDGRVKTESPGAGQSSQAASPLA